jgi:F0F1-type ATP synthase membrane subunit a
MGRLRGFRARVRVLGRLMAFALGGICFVYYLYQGFAHQGPKYLLSFFGPLWWLGWFMVVIEVVGNLFRPISLGVRLFANMFATITC